MFAEGPLITVLHGSREKIAASESIKHTYNFRKKNYSRRGVVEPLVK
jgi:hypothetical protein